MEKKLAIALSNLIEESNSFIYEISKLETINGTLPNFHQWTNKKAVISGFKVVRNDLNTCFYCIFIDWHRNGNYYLVVYSSTKKTTLAEIRQIEEVNGIPHLTWKYIPLKRDGKNDQRKAYFKQMFGSTTVYIPLPLPTSGVDKFLDQLFKLCHNRVKADQIVDVFDF